ncbi:hypothetical protein [Streptomyces sp. NPDC051662]|uniref:hypothetical protein n=1 Tax=Streptomyces sp. NPDC051662 TaxID=3154750 RepID=UPI003447E094
MFSKIGMPEGTRRRSNNSAGSVCPRQQPRRWGGKNLSQVTSGEGCLNTIAQRGADGVWRLMPDPRSHVPTWTEPCGRSSMSNNQNTQSMSLFPTWRKNNRFLEGDNYWLDANRS